MQRWFRFRTLRRLGSLSTAVFVVGSLLVVTASSTKAPYTLATHDPSHDTSHAREQAARMGFEGEGIAFYSADEPMTDSVASVLTGDKLPDGQCSFHHDPPPRAAERGVMMLRELAYDASNCRSLVEVGGLQAVPDAQVFSALDATWQSHKATARPNQGQHNPGSEGERPVQLISHTTHTHEYSQLAWFEDPPRLHVNELYIGVNWSPSPTASCPVWPAGGQSPIFAYSRWHLRATGWYEKLEGWVPSVNHCDEVMTRAWSQYGNTDFCDSLAALLQISGNIPETVVTYRYRSSSTAEYVNHDVFGHGDGRAAYQWGWSKGGGCSKLLAYKVVQFWNCKYCRADHVGDP